MTQAFATGEMHCCIIGVCMEIESALAIAGRDLFSYLIGMIALTAPMEARGRYRCHRPQSYLASR